ncbi:uncharacterized protein Teh4 [Halyomorpha halys]|uniref:uncharacterized protein Teh4 n=1 Tax=Halyomorpha halys TaxID=286706 RepID=UPI0034D2F6AE
MGKRREQKEPVVPQQDRRICGGICLCQFTIVTSCVALVYLTVAVYIPSYRAFSVGFQTEPVMCQTVNTTMVNYCDWASCGEWCLTKTSGFCPQIHVTTRRNGTKFTLEECTLGNTTGCPKPDLTKLKPYNCNNDTQCTSLTGIFNCSKGHCSNYSQEYICHNKAEGITVDASKDNLKLNGFFSCENARCTKYTKPVICDRNCTNITTKDMNVFLQFGDNVFWARCGRGIAHDEARGTDVGVVMPPKEVWHNSSNTTLMASCHTIVKNGTTISGTDCINGTLLNDLDIPKPNISFITYWKIVANSNVILDPEHKYLPPQHTLTIYNYSRLYINLEGCVNTLRGECVEFVKTHGNDGDEKTAQSRFPCFYHKNDSFMVVARFDLNKTWKELMIAIFVPSSLFVISFITLVVIGHSVHVGDDAKMRCTLCPKKPVKTKEEINAEMDLVMDGIIERTNAMAESSANTST